MAVCLVCGSEVPWPAGAPQHAGAPAVVVCSRCGTPVSDVSPPRRGQGTLLGGIEVPGAARPPLTRPQGAQRTLMGIAAPFGEVPPSGRPGQVWEDQSLTRTQPAGTPRTHDAGNPGYDPLTDPHSTAATVVDVPVFLKQGSDPYPSEQGPATHGLGGTMRIAPGIVHAPAAGAPPSRSGGTLLGVARPGIAPLSPGVQKTPIVHNDEPPPPSYRPLEELGATQQLGRLVDQRAAQAVRSKVEPAHPLGKRRFDKAIRIEGPRKDKKQAQPATSRRALVLLVLAPVLVVGAVAAVLLWPSASPLKAQVRAGEGGAEVLDVTCLSCPDGTVLKVRDAEAKVSGGRATLPFQAPLAIGDTQLTVKVDRPGSGRDEMVSLPVRVAYRIRPDLTTLEADRPSLQIVIEAMAGATVSLDGEDVPLRDGRAIKSIDITKDVTGASADAGAQLGRKISFVVKPPDGNEEKGVVAVSIPVLPLTIEAPGRAIVTEKATFLLAGRTAPGAEIVVAGRTLGTTKDGSFSQTMNVSSVGATEIEVRAKTPGRAPRLIRVAVERVISLDTAIETFQKRSPLDIAAVSKGIEASAGKPVALSGEVLDVRTSSGINTIILRAEGAGCTSGSPVCVVRLVQGRTDLGIERGAKLRAFGSVIGPVPYEGRTTFDVDVAFAIVDKPADKAPQPSPLGDRK